MDGLAIAVSLAEVRRAVEGSVVREVYQPSRGMFVLHAFRGRPYRILVSPTAASVHLSGLDIPNPPKPSVFVMLLRKHLRGGRITRVRQVGRDRVAVFDVERRHGRGVVRYGLIAELVGTRGNLVLVRDDTVLGAARRDPRVLPGRPFRPLPHQEKLDPADATIHHEVQLVSATDPARLLVRSFDGIGRQTAEDVLVWAGGADGENAPARIRAALLKLVSYLENPNPHVDAVKMRAAFYPLPAPARPTVTFAEALDRVAVWSNGFVRREEDSVRVCLLRTLRRRVRTAEKLRDWLDDADDAEELRRRADLLLIHRGDVPSGATQVTIEDPMSRLTTTIELNPTLGPVDNAQRLHARAKRLRRGRPRAEARLTQVEEEATAIEAALEALDAGEPLPEAARGFLTPPEAPGAKGGASSPRRFEVNGYVVYVGRNAAQNDRLLREASPDDVWLHVRGSSGSHVVVRRGDRREIPAEVLREAARLAVEHSKAKGERRVDVTVALAKHVRKPKAAPPGLVIVDSGDTLTVDSTPSKGLR